MRPRRNLTTSLLASGSWKLFLCCPLVAGCLSPFSPLGQWLPNHHITRAHGDTIRNGLFLEKTANVITDTSEWCFLLL